MARGPGEGKREDFFPAWSFFIILLDTVRICWEQSGCGRYLQRGRWRTRANGDVCKQFTADKVTSDCGKQLA